MGHERSKYATAEDLVRQCTEAIRDSDFPTVWHSLLRQHHLVVGPPVQYMNGGNAELHVRLLSGQRLVFDSASKTFSVT
jgi:hypothetical protein